MEGFDLSRKHNLWQILPADGTLVLPAEHPHPGAALVTYRMLAHADAVNVDILVAHHTGIIIETIVASRHPRDRNQDSLSLTFATEYFPLGSSFRSNANRNLSYDSAINSADLL